MSRNGSTQSCWDSIFCCSLCNSSTEEERQTLLDHPGTLVSSSDASNSSSARDSSSCFRSIFCCSCCTSDEEGQSSLTNSVAENLHSGRRDSSEEAAQCRDNSQLGEAPSSRRTSENIDRQAGQLVLRGQSNEICQDKSEKKDDNQEPPTNAADEPVDWQTSNLTLKSQGNEMLPTESEWPVYPERDVGVVDGNPDDREKRIVSKNQQRQISPNKSETQENLEGRPGADVLGSTDSKSHSLEPVKSESSAAERSKDDSPKPLKLILLDRIFRRCLECQYGLLDHLLRNGCITLEDFEDIGEPGRLDGARNAALIKIIDSMNMDKFKEGLKESNQSHLVNFINKCGTKDPPDDIDWPVTDSDIAPLIKSFPDLIKDLYNNSLIDRLLAENCLNEQQAKTIRRPYSVEHERNRQLLEIIMHRSVRQLNTFYDVLREDHVDLWTALEESEKKEMLALSVQEDSSNPSDDPSDGITEEKKQEILRRVDDSNLGVEHYEVDGKVYFVAEKQRRRARNITTDLTPKSLLDVGDIVNELTGNRNNFEVVKPVATVARKEKGGANMGAATENRSTDESYDMQGEGNQLTSTSSGQTGPGQMVSEATGRVDNLEAVTPAAVHAARDKKITRIHNNDTPITGVTVLPERIYIIRSEQPHVYVYDSFNLAELCDVDIPGMTSPQGLAGCSHNKALYISDDGLDTIHKVSIDNDSVTHWKIRGNYRPWGISVTGEHRVLVTIGIRGTEGQSGVLEYSSDGEKLREIIFEKSIADAWQTTQLTSELFAVSHGWTNTPQHRVCVVHTGGHIFKSYGGWRGEIEGQFDQPCSLAVDEKGKHIFVVDFHNERILLFDTVLTYQGQFLKKGELDRPYSVHFDSSNDQLFVGEWSGCLAIVPFDRQVNYYLQ